MLRINQLKLPVGHTESQLKEKVRKILRTNEEFTVEIVRRSIDARKKPELYFNYVLDISGKKEAELYRRADKKQVVKTEAISYQFPVKEYHGTERPIIVGTGPAGLFCGYMLAEAGFRPILLERGRCVDEREKDVERFWNTGVLDPVSNVQFGEGGAGTFSDGKLNTLVKDKYGRNRKVLSVFVKEGAPNEILYDYKPHIGTDVLKSVVKNMRTRILEWGGEVRFEAKVTDLLTEDDRIVGVELNHCEQLFSDHVVLAIGHSARDTLQMLYEKKIPMEAKPFAVGLRVIHPQKLINLSQYGLERVEQLGSSPYKVTASSSSGRGVYSFCMCPGGYVVNASSEEKRLAVNGMSYSGRSGNCANSAIIISVTPKDYGSDHPLAGIEFQRKLEERAYTLCDGAIPVEKYGAFRSFVQRTQKNILLEKQTKKQIPDDFLPELKGKWKEGAVHEIMPEELNRSFVEGMEQFGRVIKGFADENAYVCGIESRTSSPVRIERNEHLENSLFSGLYPCGEGAGYAGGITSAAMDGIKTAEKIARRITYGKETTQAGD